MSEAADLQLYGHDGAEASFLDARERGQLHHGWLIEGPSGIGKSILARRLAIRLLGGDPDQREDPVLQRVQAKSHPDFRWLSREADDKGKLPQDISVASARELNSFFTLRPALGGARVGVLDSLDELNRFGANAILKTLEEPPANAFILLISHGTRPVLPTIRSRCRILRLRPLASEDMARAAGVTLKAGNEPLDDLIADLSGGRPGLLHRLGEDDNRAAITAMRRFVDAFPRPKATDIAGVISALGRSEASFDAGTLGLLNWLARESRKRNGREAALWSKAWLDVSRSVAEARELALDRTQVAASLIERVQGLASA